MSVFPKNSMLPWLFSILKFKTACSSSLDIAYSSLQDGYVMYPSRGGFGNTSITSFCSKTSTCKSSPYVLFCISKNTKIFESAIIPASSKLIFSSKHIPLNIKLKFVYLTDSGSTLSSWSHSSTSLKTSMSSRHRWISIISSLLESCWSSIVRVRTSSFSGRKRES